MQIWVNIVTCRGDLFMGFGSDHWIYCSLYTDSSELQAIQRYRYSTHFQFTVAQALGFSVFTTRILATDLSQSHCNLKSHMMSSLHRLIPFLPFLLNHLQPPSPELDPILILAAWDPRYIISGRSYRKHRFLQCCEGVFTVQLHSNGSYSIVACVFIAAGVCLPSRCLAMSTHVTIILK
jgi:hypothetical protein